VVEATMIAASDVLGPSIPIVVDASVGPTWSDE